jgi:hypothetical protein
MASVSCPRPLCSGINVMNACSSVALPVLVLSGQQIPDYVCQGERVRAAQPVCQHVSGAALDRAISELLIAAMTPLALEIALAVQAELQELIDEADRLRYKKVEQTRYEAYLARRHYLHVDPANRLVADSLEFDWNCDSRAGSRGSSTDGTSAALPVTCSRPSESSTIDLNIPARTIYRLRNGVRLPKSVSPWRTRRLPGASLVVSADSSGGKLPPR